MLEMAKTNLYNLIACLFGDFLAGFRKASKLRERIGIIKCLGCFFRKLIRKTTTTKTFTGGKYAIKQTTLKQTQSFFERKYYSRVCQTVCRGIKWCERKSSLVIEVNKKKKENGTV